MLRSIVVKNVLLFLVILVVAVLPLSWQYYRDSRNAEIQTLASKLEFFAERGASWLDVPAIGTIMGAEQKTSAAYARLLGDLKRIKQEFDVDNAVVLRRQADGGYVYVAIDHGEFDPGDRAHIHDLFPATSKATSFGSIPGSGTSTRQPSSVVFTWNDDDEPAAVRVGRSLQN